MMAPCLAFIQLPASLFLLSCSQEEEETESVKAERAKAKAHRDKLAQMALDRRRIKAQLQEAQQQVVGVVGGRVARRLEVDYLRVATLARASPLLFLWCSDYFRD